MNVPHSDALVFFGATGDLAYKKIFPSLQAMVKRGHLDVPVIGVAKAGWNVDQLRARARDSVEKHGGGVEPAAFDKLCRLLRYVDGDYKDAATFQAIRKELGLCAAACALPRHPACAVRPRRRTINQRHAALMVLASSLKNPSVTTSSRRRNSIGFCSALSTSSTSSASIIIWGNEQCVTWFSYASRMQFWSRSGTGIRSRACR